MSTRVNKPGWYSVLRTSCSGRAHGRTDVLSGTPSTEDNSVILLNTKYILRNPGQFKWPATSPVPLPNPVSLTLPACIRLWNSTEDLSRDWRVVFPLRESLLVGVMLVYRFSSFSSKEALQANRRRSTTTSWRLGLTASTVGLSQVTPLQAACAGRRSVQPSRLRTSG